MRRHKFAKPTCGPDFIELLVWSHKQLHFWQELIKYVFEIDKCERFQYDQRTGLIIFTTSEKPQLKVRFECVGSLSKVTGTWLWAWANPNILPAVKSKIERVRRFGERKGFNHLTKAKWFADAKDGWEMTSIARYVLKAKGAYRVQTEEVFLYMVLLEIEDLREAKQ